MRLLFTASLFALVAGDVYAARVIDSADVVPLLAGQNATVGSLSITGAVPSSTVLVGPTSGPGAPTQRQLTTGDVTEGTNLYFTIPRASAAAPVQSVSGRTGAIALSVSDISGAAPTASPTFTTAVYLPTWASAPATTAGLIGYNTATGRVDFGIGASVVNHVRLSGDTMTGALHMGANVLDGSAVAFTGGAISGITLSGTIAGSPTWSGNHTWSGTQTYNAGLTFNGANTVANGHSFGFADGSGFNAKFLASGNTLTFSGTNAVGSGVTIWSLPLENNSPSLSFSVPVNVTGSASVAAVGGGTIFSVSGSASAIANNLTVIGGAAGAAPQIAAAGSDTNIQLILHGKGGYAAAGAGAVVVNNSPLNLTPGLQTVATDVVPGLSATMSLAGTATGNPNLIYSAYSFIVSADTLALPGANQFFIGSNLQENFGGAAMTGNRLAFQASLTQTAATGNTLAGADLGFYQGLQATAAVSFNDAGTGLTSTTAHGRVFGGGAAAQCKSGATFMFQCAALELNASVYTGASTLVRSFLSVAAVGGAVQGSAVDAGIWYYNTGGALIKTGILFGGGGLNNFPIDPVGAYIADDATGAITATAAYGIHFVGAFTTASIAVPGFTVDGSGGVAAASYKAGASSGVSCSGSPTASFAAVGGIVTHC